MKTQLQIVDLLGKGSSYPNEIARKLSISPSQAQKWLLWLLEKGMVVRKKGDLKRVFYSLNTESFEIIAYRKAILAEKLKKSKYWKNLCKLTPCGIYGSFALGTFDENSDIDLWAYIEKQDRRKIREIADKLGDEFKRQVNLVYLDKTYLKNMRNNDPEFFYRLKLQSITQHLEVFNVA